MKMPKPFRSDVLFVSFLLCRTAIAFVAPMIRREALVQTRIHGWTEAASSLTTSLATAASTRPATGHSQPLFGPPDPYLQAGKSIAPSARALADMGVTPFDNGALPTAVQNAAAGWTILDSSRLTQEVTLPGFSPTRGILPSHSPVPAETAESFAAQVEWSAAFLRVVDNLPSVVFFYALVEFFLLRPNVDLYQQELGQPDVVRGVVTVTGVRVAAFCLIAAVTCVLTP